MANLIELLVDKFKEFQASQEFDKEALIEAHEKTFKGLCEIESKQGKHATTGRSIRKPSEHWRPSVPLKGLLPIRARELQVDNYHRGRVLLGTLCAKAHIIVGIMTILEDQFGDAVRLAIYNVPPSELKTVGPRKLYPKGSKVAVKQPYFKQGAQDGALMLRVDNPQDVEILPSFPGNAESNLGMDLLELRNQGNKCFRDGDWSKAIHFYSKSIDLALSTQKIEPSASNTEEKVKEGLVHSYSNRAEAKLRLNKYGDAVKDCDEALALDHHHLKSLFRKGRALHCLREYKLACQCFDRALENAPTAKDIQLQYEKSMELSHQSEQGKFNLSPYLINGCNAPELSNYVGPVLIKKSVGRGRGLFATDDVDIGDFLLVDNAIASSRTELQRFKTGSERGMVCGREMKTKLDHVKQDLEAKITTSAASSARVQQQLEYLADSDEMKVPPMDLFRINNTSWNNYDVPNQCWELDEHKLAKLMLNVGCRIQVTDSSSLIMTQTEQHGLWVLPSFINHSCLPNANCIVVEEAMFIIAARKIPAGEEVTIPYSNTFVPLFGLFGRESICSRMGFKCECKRCMLERSLLTADESKLQEVAKIVNTLDSTILFDIELWADAMQVENIIAGLPVEEKQMIRASYFPLYHNIFVLGRMHPNAITTLPSPRELFDGFQEVVPGNYVCLALFAKVPGYAENEDETNRVGIKKALEVCKGYMGKHEEDLLEAVLKSVERDIYTPPFTVFRRTDVNS